MKFKTKYNFDPKRDIVGFVPYDMEQQYIKEICEETGEITLVKNGKLDINEQIQLERSNCMELNDAIEIIGGEMVPKGGIDKYTYTNTTDHPKTKAELHEHMLKTAEAKAKIALIEERKAQLQLEKSKKEAEAAKIKTTAQKAAELMEKKLNDKGGQ